VRKLDTGMKIAFDEMSAYRHRLAVAKIPAVIEHCDDMLESVSKLVIFGHHKDVIGALAEHYKDCCVVLDGSTPNEERQDVVDKFQTNPTCKVFIGSIHAAGVGITLTAASHVVFAELDWVPAWITQSEDRLHRLSQKDNVTVQHLVVDGSLDARLAETLVWKQEIIERALDKQAPEIAVAAGEASQQNLPMPKAYPVATPEQRNACAEGVSRLAGMCDGAVQQDGTGFNKLDSRTGKSLAFRTMTRELTDGEVYLCKKMLLKYHTQIGKDLINRIKGT